MKFCDKLQKLRKENNLTQEQLANKLGVSRQAVSKWESDIGYPDTEKLIQLSKIFNISMDELVNGNKPIKKDEKNDKIDFLSTINNVLDFILKSFSMFCNMKFKDKIKCLLEIFIIVIIILCFSLISTEIIINLLKKIIMFLPSNYIYVFINSIESILYIIWFIFGFVIILKIFKVRYLNYYIVSDIELDDKSEEKELEFIANRNTKLIIRDPKHSNINIFNKIINFSVFLFKCFCIILLIPIVILFILIMLLFVFSLFYILDGLIFNGISVVLIGSICFIYLLIEFIYNFIFNRKHHFMRIFVIFIISISLVGIGGGLSLYSLFNFNMIDSDYEINNHIIEMDNDLVIEDIMYLDKDKIIIDNQLDYIKLDIKEFGISNVNIYKYNNGVCGDRYGEIKYCKVIHIYNEYDEFESYKYFVSNLRNNKLIINNNYYEIDKVYISQKNLDMLIDNFRKYRD